jgi:hypothetical protein
MLPKYILVSLLAAFAIAAPHPVEQVTDSYDSSDNMLIDDQQFPKGAVRWPLEETIDNR